MTMKEEEDLVVKCYKITVMCSRETNYKEYYQQNKLASF